MFTFSQEDVPEIKSPVPNSHCDYSIDFVSTELGKQNKKWECLKGMPPKGERDRLQG